MIMIAALLVRTLSQQEVVIAQLEFLQSVKLFTRDTLEIESIHTLTISVPFHSPWGTGVSHLGSNDLKFQRVAWFIGGWYD